MNVLVLTTVFPNTAQPFLGLFVRERIRHAAQHGSARVVAPIGWTKRLRQRGIASAEDSGGLVVDHPTFFYVPGVFKVLDGLFLFLSVLPHVTRIRRRFAFDLVDAHFGYPEGVAAVLLGRWFRCPVVLTFRGSEIVIARSVMRRMLMGWALRRATRIITVSKELATLAVAMGAAADNVSVIRNGVDCERFTASDRLADRLALNIGESERLIVTVGHLVPGKGFHRVIEAMARTLRGSSVPVRLAIVGGRSYGSRRYPEQLVTRAEAAGIGQHVHFTGAQPPAQVARWLRAADLFVLASDREGCPNVVLEAMACGTPVVAAAVGDVPSMVPEWAGIVYDPADPAALDRALEAALGRSWDRARIRSYAETQSWPLVARRVQAQWASAARGEACSPVVLA